MPIHCFTPLGTPKENLTLLQDPHIESGDFYFILTKDINFDLVTFFSERKFESIAEKIHSFFFHEPYSESFATRRCACLLIREKSRPAFCFLGINSHPLLRGFLNIIQQPRPRL